MPENQIDVRDLPPQKRHPTIHDAFGDLDSGEALTLVNDHDPKPLFYEFQAEVDDFDADGYTVDRVADDEFIATLPKE